MTQALPIRQFLLTNMVRSTSISTSEKGSDGLLRFRIPVKILAMHLDEMGSFPFHDPDLNRFDGPTLMIRGTKSHYVADDVLPLVGRFFPRFVVRDIDAGHWVISEKPEAFRQGMFPLDLLPCSYYHGDLPFDKVLIGLMNVE